VSTQIAVRLPDDTVAFLDRLVAEKKAASRAEIITRALEYERRREMAARDAAILAESGEDPDLAGLIRYMTGHPVDPDRQ
jgi:Arc/MetJ-type ribon-helix-helix transcriptional regulator